MENTVKRLGYYHSKDMDGYFSGAVLKYKYPDIELRGWDYKDAVPSFEETEGFDEIILIDITFPLSTLLELGTKTKLTVIDHHISFKRQVDGVAKGYINFEYIFDQNLSACELGMKYYFGHVPAIVELVGKYDTWRGNGTPDWEESILPMKYWMYGNVNKPEDVDMDWLDEIQCELSIERMIETGKSILSYERKMDEARTNSYAFEREAYGLRALCINTNFMSSETMITKFDPEKHDIQIGFAYTGNLWSVSLRSIEGGVNVADIAKARSGGGHAGAGGFQVNNFEDIFK